jgi:hypothetical protein
MVKVYAVALIVGLVALIAWILAHAAFSGSPDRDPEERFGVPGRRAVAGLVGFAMAGLSAEFSPRDLSWPIALVLAVVGAAALGWYAGRPALADSAGDPDTGAKSELSD